MLFLHILHILQFLHILCIMHILHILHAWWLSDMLNSLLYANILIYADILTCKPIDMLTYWKAYTLRYWPVDWQTYWYFDLLIFRQSDMLTLWRDMLNCVDVDKNPLCLRSSNQPPSFYRKMFEITSHLFTSTFGQSCLLSFLRWIMTKWHRIKVTLAYIHEFCT